MRTEVCQPDHSRFCQKVTNEHPEPEQRQNCHFEPKKVRPALLSSPSSSSLGVRAAEAHEEQEGQEVQLQPGLPARGQEHLRDLRGQGGRAALRAGRAISSASQYRPKILISPQESRLTCTYVAKEKCMEKSEQYCYKQEVKTQVEVCDDKFTTYNL